MEEEGGAGPEGEEACPTITLEEILELGVVCLEMIRVSKETRLGFLRTL